METESSRIYQETLNYSVSPNYLPSERETYGLDPHREQEDDHINKHDVKNQGLQFYKKQIHFMFEMYMEGSLSIEEFVRYRSWPQVAMRELGLENLMHLSEKLSASPKVDESKSIKNQVKSLKIKPKDSRSKLHKEFLKKVLSKVEKHRNKSTVLLSDVRGQEIKARINKLKKFMVEKMKDRRKGIQNDSTIDSFKLFNVIMNVANETITKLENRNMIDSFNLNNFKAEIQKSPIYLSDMSIRTKAFAAKADQTYSEREGEKVHLKRFLRDMDNKSSTHAQLVVSVFDQIVDRYYKHLRPPTPPQIKETAKNPKMTNNENNGEMHEKHVDRSFSNYKSHSTERMEDRLAKNIRNNSFKLDPVYEAMFDTAPRTLKTMNSIGKQFNTLKGLPHESSNIINSGIQDNLQAQKEYFLGPRRPTFVSTLRRTVDNRDTIEYQYHREKRLLQYLKLDGRPYKDQRKLLDQKINNLVCQHKQIDEDKDNLLEKINSFNPLDLEDLKKYINHTNGYAVI